MSAFVIADLNDEEKRLIARFTFRIFADMKRYVELGGVLTVSKLQATENDLVQQITAQWLERTDPSPKRVEGSRQ